MLRSKSVAYYFKDKLGFWCAVSKNSATRMRKKMDSKDFLKAGEIYAMKIHRVVRDVTVQK